MNYDDLRNAIREKVLVMNGPKTRIIAADEVSIAPWLMDFRALLLQPAWLKRYAEVFWDTFGDLYPFQVCGMESAAISLVAAIVMEGAARNKPANGLFIRKSRKRYGLMKQHEGSPTKDPVILVDDLINSGRTFEKQIKVLEREGLTVSGLFALVAFRDASAYVSLASDARPLRTVFSLKEFGLSVDAARESRPQLREIWRFAAPDPSLNYVVQKSAPVIDEERIYIGSDAGVFYAIEQKDGAVAWKFETGSHPPGKGVFSTPALYNGIVYFGAYDGNVYALDAKTGGEIWTYADADWVGSSPSLAPEKDLLFIGLEFGLFRKRGGIAALRATTGERVWEQRTPEHTHGSPLYIREKNMVVVGSNDNIVYAYRADTGEQLWKFRAAGSVKSGFAYDPKRQFILFGSLGGIFYALSQDGTPVYAHEMGTGMYSTPLVAGDSVYFTSLDKQLYAIDLRSGKVRWNYATNGRIFASPVMIGNSIFVGSNDGCLHEIDAENGSGRWTFQATERIVNKIAYNPATERFFVPTVANELYCLHRA